MSRRVHSSSKMTASANSQDIYSGRSATRALRNINHCRASTRRGYALVVGVIALVGSGILYASMMTFTQDSASPSAQPMSKLELQATLSRIGFSPSALGAAGVEPGQIAGIVLRTQSALAEHLEALRSADAARDQQMNLVFTYEQATRSEQATPQDQERLVQARADLKTKADQSDAIVNAIRSAIEANLTESQVQALASIRKNKDREVPVEYQITDRTDKEWVELRESLANIRIAAQYGEDTPQKDLDVLAQADANPAVVVAKRTLETRKTEIEQAWESALTAAVSE